MEFRPEDRPAPAAGRSADKAHRPAVSEVVQAAPRASGHLRASSRQPVQAAAAANSVGKAEPVEVRAVSGARVVRAGGNSAVRQAETASQAEMASRDSNRRSARSDD
jgi:transcriptional regulator of nitric oxide reductase